MYTIELDEDNNSVFKIITSEPFKLSELEEILSFLSEAFKKNKKFGFYGHFNVSKSPLSVISMTQCLSSWLLKNESNIVNYLTATAIIINSPLFADIFTGIFKIRPTKRPNIITTDYEKGRQFVLKETAKLT